MANGLACLPHGGAPPRPVPVGELDAGWTQQFTMPQKTLAVKSSYRRARPAGRGIESADRSSRGRPRMVSSRRAFLSTSGGSPDTTTTNGRQRQRASREQDGVGQGGASARLLSSRSTRARAVCLLRAFHLSTLDAYYVCMAL